MSLAATNNLIEFICNKVKIYYDYSINPEIEKVPILVYNGIYRYHEYWKQMDKLSAAFREEIELFLIENESPKKRIDFFNLVSEKLQYAQAKSQTHSFAPHKYKGSPGEFEDFVYLEINANKVPVFHSNAECIKDILENYHTLKEYHSYRHHCIYNLHREYLIAARKLINERIEIEKKNADYKTNEKPNSSLYIKEKDEKYDQSIENKRSLTVRANNISDSFVFRLPKVDDAYANQIIEIEDLHRKLYEGKFIDRQTTEPNFKRIFSGKKVKHRVKWVGAKIELKYFIKYLYPLLNNGPKEKWQVTVKCFTSVDGSDFNTREIGNAKDSDIKELRKNKLNDYVLSLRDSGYFSSTD